jgi:hypothetical protein
MVGSSSSLGNSVILEAELQSESLSWRQATHCMSRSGVQAYIINIHRQFVVFLSAFASVTSLTRRSTGHQRAAHVAAG